jgi:hypothetical protein
VTFTRCVSLILVVALLVVTVQPAPAEALEPTTILLIAGAGIAVIALIAILIIANVTEKSPRTAQAQAESLLAALQITPFPSVAIVPLTVEPHENP